MHILAIDQGTSSSRAIVFDAALRPLATAQQAFTQYFPNPGWVEHDPEEIWSSTLATCREALEKAGPARAIGISNQRETVVIWDRRTGVPIHNALVWQDRRTAELCAQLRKDGHEPMIRARTGLLLDPYFSATKAAWLLDNVPGARADADAGHLAMGTIDSFLIWRLTRGRTHATDATNASRTLLYDLNRADWDPELCSLFRIPPSILPEIRDCTAGFGSTETSLFGQPIPILGVAGDQQAAAIGQACFTPGMMKSTYGTGCFALMNTGTTPITSRNRLLTTLAWRIDGESHFALEGSIFIAGAVVQWLRDGLKLIASAPETQALAEASRGGLILVPAFTGLGAPWWIPEARGAIYGLTRDTGPADFARAALESVGFQSADLHAAMLDDWSASGTGGAASVLRVDGGMSASNYAMQFLADIIGAPVERPAELEASATGAAWLAGSAAGLTGDRTAFASQWRREHRFEPQMPDAVRDARRAAWRRAVEATIHAAGSAENEQSQP